MERVGHLIQLVARKWGQGGSWLLSYLLRRAWGLSPAQGSPILSNRDRKGPHVAAGVGISGHPVHLGDSGSTSPGKERSYCSTTSLGSSLQSACWSVHRPRHLVEGLQCTQQ